MLIALSILYEKSLLNPMPFVKKVTYKVGKKIAEDTIAEFRTNPQLRVGVTVDMIATDTDIRPLEIVMFMCDVKSPAYYEQMKGRGTRILSEDELRKVTPDARTKTRFVLIRLCRGN